MRPSRLAFAALPLTLVLALTQLHCGGDEDGDTGAKGLPTRSPGCGTGASPSPAEGSDGAVNGRTYKYYVPTGYDPERAYPVIYVLHGTGATGAAMSRYIKMQEYSDGNAIVVFPDAAGGKWNTKDATDLEFFDAMNEKLGAELCTNPSRVFVTGFSLGGYMTNYLGCKRGAKIRAIAPAAGGFPGSSDGCASVAAFVYHKTQDSTVKVDEGKKARDTWKTLDGCSDDTDAYGDLGCVEHRGCKDGTSLVWCEDPQQTKYPHDLDAAYRVPLWQWFDAMK